ncbi:MULTISPECIES: DUF1120 domain-containing protein [Pseudomonas]|uniref:DUF1120 domain-containing protein n=1 Tax=Pseudomonas TaxID=286 RepID=UPI000CFCDA1A|nr:MULTISPECIES: DUF1120 domain-containing protein [Pseudomonas]PQZ95493.1 hypothetical protein CQ048_01605 [Pseudomonas trivialis]PRB30390.1 hypothetical protein CQ041_01090 [Pseudomonas sp. MYb60]
MKPILIQLSACVWLSTGAHAASSVDLNVTGHITPSACEPTLSSGGQYDLGKIPVSDLNLDQPTKLPVHNLQLAITCEALTLLALEPRDNRLGSSYNDFSTNFGLGLVSGDKKLGYVQLRLLAIVADGTGVHPIGSSGPGTWAPISLMSHYFLTSFAATSSSFVPVPIQQLNADLQISPTVAPANTLPLTEALPIDGSVTLSMNYL